MPISTRLRLGYAGCRSPHAEQSSRAGRGRRAPVSFFIATPPSVASRLNQPFVSQVTTFDASVSFITYVLGRISVGKNADEVAPVEIQRLAEVTICAFAPASSRQYSSSSMK